MNQISTYGCPTRLACRATCGDLPTRQVLVMDGPHPSAELVTVAATLRAPSSSLAVPRRALTIGRKRSSTDNHGSCPCPPSCTISPSGAGRGCFPKLVVSCRELPNRATLQAFPRPLHVVC